MDFFEFEEEIVNVMKGGNTVFLLGSGISANSGLPSWSDFLTNFSDFCDSLGCDTSKARELISTNQFSSATEALIDDVGQKEFENFISSLELFKNANPNELHGTLLKFPSKRFLTTNIDTLIEKSFQLEFKKSLSVFLNSDREGILAIQSRDVDEFVYKYHGCVHKPKSVVFSESHYDQIIYNERVVKDVLLTIFKTFKVVLVGFGGTDFDFVPFQKEIKALLGEKSTDIYAFLPDVTDKQRKKLNDKLQIKAISYDVIDGEHKLNDALLYILNKIDEDKKDDLRGFIEIQEAPVILGTLDREITNINHQLLPIDKRCLGIIQFMNGMNKNDLYLHVCNEVFSSDFIDGRLLSFVHGGLLKSTKNLYLPIDSNVMREAALLVEDEMIMLFSGVDDE